MIDRIRSQIQERLDQLLAEADKLRHALSALDPRDSSSSTPTPSRPRAAKARANRSAAAPAAATGADGAARARTAPGATKRAVLAALDSERALTAGEVAAATGLARPTVSTTLSKLATSGEIVKAQRGYQLSGNGQSGAKKAAALK
jgi:DNA-binding transcriptional ArsR family regulator